jgi:hypothetical protein
MSAPNATVAELRAAAARLVDSQGDTVIEDMCPSIPKRLLAALVEDAIPDAPVRGLIYPEEFDDIGNWLTAFAGHGEQDRCDHLLAAVGAWHADYVDPETANDPRKELVRAIARYFLRDYAGTAANLIEDDARCGREGGGK